MELSTPYGAFPDFAESQELLKRSTGQGRRPIAEHLEEPKRGDTERRDTQKLTAHDAVADHPWYCRQLEAPTGRVSITSEHIEDGNLADTFENATLDPSPVPWSRLLQKEVAVPGGLLFSEPAIYS